jgi:Zn-dependent membrane protease YugP
MRGLSPVSSDRGCSLDGCSLGVPVEFDATARAKRLAVDYGIVMPQEREGMDRVLNAAALTYVAAVISTLMTLLYYLLRAGLLGGRRS